MVVWSQDEASYEPNNPKDWEGMPQMKLMKPLVKVKSAISPQIT